MGRYRHLPTQSFRPPRRWAPDARDLAGVIAALAAVAGSALWGPAWLLPVSCALVAALVIVLAVRWRRRGTGPQWARRERVLRRDLSPLRARAEVLREWSEYAGVEMGPPVPVADTLDLAPGLLLDAGLAYVDRDWGVHIQEHRLRLPVRPDIAARNIGGWLLMGGSLGDEPGEHDRRHRAITLVIAPSTTHMAGLLLRPRRAGAPDLGTERLLLENRDLARHVDAGIDPLHPQSVGLLLLPPDLQEQLARHYADPAARMIRLLRARPGSLTAMIDAPLAGHALPAAQRAALIMRDILAAWASR